MRRLNGGERFLAAWFSSRKPTRAGARCHVRKAATSVRRVAKSIRQNPNCRLTDEARRPLSGSAERARAIRDWNVRKFPPGDQHRQPTCQQQEQDAVLPDESERGETQKQKEHAAAADADPGLGTRERDADRREENAKDLEPGTGIAEVDRKVGLTR